MSRSGAEVPGSAEPSARGPETAGAAGHAPTWLLRDRRLRLDRPRVMGILNVTPDSFSDGGRFLDPGAAEAHARSMLEAGADLIDVGAESSRPGAEPVSAREEWARLAPVLARLRALEAPVSVDTTKAEVARRALDAGAAAINDISALRFDPDIARVAAEEAAGLVLMHMRGDPRTMQRDTSYRDLLGEVVGELAGAADRARDAGCADEQLVLDPGLGFGKSAEGSLELLARLDELAARLRALGQPSLPILVGPSRKSFIGSVLGLPPAERLEGTVAACVLALERGARLFRVHDVAPVRRALDLAAAVLAHGALGAGPGDSLRGRPAVRRSR